MTSYQSQRVQYIGYLEKHTSFLEESLVSSLLQRLETSNLENPSSAEDYNNVAVLALVAAEFSEDLESRRLYLDFAIETLQESISIHNAPLARVHLALVQCLLGEYPEAAAVAYQILLDTLQACYVDSGAVKMLVYVPPQFQRNFISMGELLVQLLECQTIHQQIVLLCSEALCRARLVLYDSVGLRTLELLSKLQPESCSLKLKKGIYYLLQQQMEGLLDLHQAEVTSNQPLKNLALQSLVIGYKNFQVEKAGFWLRESENLFGDKVNKSREYQWIGLSLAKPFTYLPFDNNSIIAVNPSFSSIVTCVLLAEGDWFESEMEFWRDFIQAGMTVIDVGANVGVYTVSAAQRVGPTGRVLAIEPFSESLNCLKETCRINQFDWVTLCEGAASDSISEIQLLVRGASELNEVVTATDLPPSATTQTVPCFTLDSLIEKYDLERIDVLKIDAEGHELNVLQGSEEILKRYRPVILYENRAGVSSGNPEVSSFLVQRDYQIMGYRPYIKELYPVNSKKLSDLLNIIAFPT